MRFRDSLPQNSARVANRRWIGTNSRPPATNATGGDRRVNEEKYSRLATAEATEYNGRHPARTEPPRVAAETKVGLKPDRRGRTRRVASPGVWGGTGPKTRKSRKNANCRPAPKSAPVGCSGGWEADLTDSEQRVCLPPDGKSRYGFGRSILFRRYEASGSRLQAYSLS